MIIVRLHYYAFLFSWENFFFLNISRVLKMQKFNFTKKKNKNLSNFLIYTSHCYFIRRIIQIRKKCHVSYSYFTIIKSHQSVKERIRRQRVHVCAIEWPIYISILLLNEWDEMCVCAGKKARVLKQLYFCYKRNSQLIRNS